MRIRNITGGPSPERTSEALARGLDRQNALEVWLATKLDSLEALRRGP